MNPDLHISAHETGAVRVFSVSMPAADLTPYMLDNALIGELLGAPIADPQYVELFPISDLEGLGLIGYLTEGQGVPPDLVADDRARLAALDGNVLVLLSGAFDGDTNTTLALDPRLTLIGTYIEKRPARAPVALPSASAKGTLSSAPPTLDAAPPRSGLWIWAVLLFGLSALVYWMAA